DISTRGARQTRSRLGDSEEPSRPIMRPISGFPRSFHGGAAVVRKPQLSRPSVSVNFGFRVRQAKRRPFGLALQGTYRSPAEGGSPSFGGRRWSAVFLRPLAARPRRRRNPATPS